MNFKQFLAESARYSDTNPNRFEVTGKCSIDVAEYAKKHSEKPKNETKGNWIFTDNHSFSFKSNGVRFADAATLAVDRFKRERNTSFAHLILVA